MKVKKREDLTNKNTMHLRATAQNFFIPENEEELQKLLVQLKGEKYFILSGGSNLLLDDKTMYENVIYMGKVDSSLKKIGEEKFYIGASNKISRVINYINSQGCGGFEELFCLPALFGGIIYMNAGIGGEKNIKFNISYFIDRVKVLNKKNIEIEWLSNKDCNFSHRKSIFQDDKYIILGAEISVQKQNVLISKEKINARIKYCKEKQEWGKGCFGSLFSIANPKLLKLSKKIKKQYGGIKFADNNSNWLVNTGTGTYNDVLKIIKMCKILHKITLQKNEIEVRTWK